VRRRTRITLEGLSFLAILTFIVLGAILRQINILVLLSGLMIAPFFFNWRISRRMLNGIRLRRIVPSRVHAGSAAPVAWELRNGRRRMACWGIRISDTIRGQEPDDKPRKAELLIHHVSPLDMQTSRYQCTIARRGVYELGPAIVSCAFPTGLVRSRLELTGRDRLVVAPALGRLSRTWYREILFGRESGNRADSRRRGRSGEEFFSLRNWQHGDNRRMIHWRSSAKRGDLLVRQGVAPRTLHLDVLFDLADGPNGPIIETLASLAATMACQAQASSGAARIRLAIYGSVSSGAPLAIGPRIIPSLLEVLATVRGASHTGILAAIAGCHRRDYGEGRIIVFSNRTFAAALAAESAPGGSDLPPDPATVVWMDLSNGHPWFEPPVRSGAEQGPVAPGSGLVHAPGPARMEVETREGAIA
jgi:uncharacterized protein (DUF58 family)